MWPAAYGNGAGQNYVRITEALRRASGMVFSGPCGAEEGATPARQRRRAVLSEAPAPLPAGVEMRAQPAGGSTSM